jgi:hypothetical protein
LGGLEARATVLFRTWKSSEHGGQVREEEEEDGKANSQTSARRTVLKGPTRPLTFNSGPTRSARLSPTHARVPAKQPPTRATPRSPQSTDLQSLRAVMMERSCLSHRPRCPPP